MGNRGLVALAPACPKLGFVSVGDGSQISVSGITEFLSFALPNLTAFNANGTKFWVGSKEYDQMLEKHPGVDFMTPD